MKKVFGNDSFQRMNYLYQARGRSYSWSSRGRFPGLTTIEDLLNKWTRMISKHIANTNPVLSSYYGNLIVNVAKKTVLKTHPDLKRQICKKCRCILIHKVTANMKIRRKNKSKIIKWMCNNCGAQRNFPAEKDKDHTVWLEKPEAVVDVIN